MRRPSDPRSPRTDTCAEDLLVAVAAQHGVHLPFADASRSGFTSGSRLGALGVPLPFGPGDAWVTRAAVDAQGIHVQPCALFLLRAAGDALGDAR